MKIKRNLSKLQKTLIGLGFVSVGALSVMAFSPENILTTTISELFINSKAASNLLQTVGINADHPTSNSGWYLNTPTITVNLNQGVPNVKYAITTSESRPSESQFITVDSNTLGYASQYRYRFITPSFIWSEYKPTTGINDWIKTGNSYDEYKWITEHLTQTHLDANSVKFPVGQQFYIDSQGNRIPITDINTVNPNTTVYEYGISGFFYDQPLKGNDNCYLPLIDYYISNTELSCTTAPTPRNGTSMKGDSAFYKAGSNLPGAQTTWNYGSNLYEYPQIHTSGYENTNLFVSNLPNNVAANFTVTPISANDFIGDNIAYKTNANLIGTDFHLAKLKRKAIPIYEWKSIADTDYLFTTDHHTSTNAPNSSSTKEWAQVTKEFKITLPNDGIYYIHIKQDDGLGNSSYHVSQEIKIDKTAPTFTSTTDAAGNINYTAQDATSDVDYVKLPNNTTTTNKTGNYKGGTDGYFNFEVFDKAGNSYATSVVIMKDNAPPTASHILSPDIWTNTNVTITVTGYDSSGIKNIIRPDGSSTNGETTNYTVNSNGIYNFTIIDNAENEFIYPVNVDNIDKILPTGNISTSQETLCTNSDVYITFNASDKESGLNKIQYQVNNGGWTTVQNHQTIINNQSGAYTYKLWAQDIALNADIIATANIRIDKDKPTGAHSLNPSGTTNGNVTITVNASDVGCGVKEIQKPDGEKVSGSSASYIVNTNGTYSFYLIDQAQNTTKYDVRVSNIDNGAPELTLTVPNPNEWTQSKTITAEASDPNGIRWIKTPNGNLIYSSSATYTVYENNYYYFETEDGAGNKTRRGIYVGRIDRQAPNLHISNPSNSNWINEKVEITLETWD